MLDLLGAGQIKQKMEAAGDSRGAALFDRLIKDAQRGLVSTAPLYVDASRAAQLEYGAHTVNCPTLQEAKIAWDKLPAERKEVAVITSARHKYTASEIDRFHYQ
jgi:hypothetical protein